MKNMRPVFIPHPAGLRRGRTHGKADAHGRAMPEGRYESQMFLGSRGT